MLKIPCLSTDPYRSVKIKWQLVCLAVAWGFARLGLDKAIKSGDVLELGVGVEQEGRVIYVRESAIV
jgi:hypothetical protein